MIWGAFIALTTIAKLSPDEIWAHIDILLAKFEQGSVITVIWGIIKLFASLAFTKQDYSYRLFPVLIQTLETCIPRDIPTHAENMLPAITAGNKDLIYIDFPAERVDTFPVIPLPAGHQNNSISNVI